MQGLSFTFQYAYCNSKCMLNCLLALYKQANQYIALHSNISIHCHWSFTTSFSYSLLAEITISFWLWGCRLCSEIVLDLSTFWKLLSVVCVPAEWSVAYDQVICLELTNSFLALGGRYTSGDSRSRGERLRHDLCIHCFVCVTHSTTHSGHHTSQCDIVKSHRFPPQIRYFPYSSNHCKYFIHRWINPSCVFPHLLYAAFYLYLGIVFYFAWIILAAYVQIELWRSWNCFRPLQELFTFTFKLYCNFRIINSRKFPEKQTENFKVFSSSYAVQYK